MPISGLPIAGAQPCLGSSLYLPNFVEQTLHLNPTTVYKDLDSQSPWTSPQDPDLKYRGRPLPRQKAFWTRSDGGVDVTSCPDPIRRYSYPGFQYGSMLSYRPFEATETIRLMADHLQSISVDGHPIIVNHCIGTRYNGPEDNISAHSDKTKDIQPASSIIMLSFGEVREMHITCADEPVQVFVLNPGDAFLLSWDDNIKYKHAIVPVADEQKIVRSPPNDTVCPRISLVFRDICTLVSLTTVRKKVAVTRARRDRKRQREEEAE